MVAMVLVGMLFYVPLAASLALLATYSQMATCCSWRGMCTISRIYLNPCGGLRLASHDSYLSLSASSA